MQQLACSVWVVMQLNAQQTSSTSSDCTYPSLSNPLHLRLLCGAHSASEASSTRLPKEPFSRTRRTRERNAFKWSQCRIIIIRWRNFTIPRHSDHARLRCCSAYKPHLWFYCICPACKWAAHKFDVATRSGERAPNGCERCALSIITSSSVPRSAVRTNRCCIALSTNHPQSAHRAIIICTLHGPVMPPWRFGLD